MSTWLVDDARDQEEEGGRHCALCSTPIQGEFFLVGDDSVCPRCRREVETLLTNQTAASRALRAVVLGGLAAALGALLYFAVLFFTGYEFSLVAIIVGFMVGKAVSVGSSRKGGVGYQLLAVCLTYSAIVVTYMPFILQAIVDEQPAIEETVGADAVAGDRGDDDPEAASAGDAMLFLGLLFVIAAAAPVLAGVENIIGMAIIAFGLYQAWSLNRRLEISGPYEEGRLARI